MVAQASISKGPEGFRRIAGRAENLASTRIGARYGCLTVEAEAEPYYWRGRPSRRKWLCSCTCGQMTIVRDDSLKNGHTRSCGCERVRTNIAVHTVHGGRSSRRRSPSYSIWSDLVRRAPARHVPAKWRSTDRRSGFLAFIEDVGERPSRLHHLVRIDRSAPYSRKNCRWELTPKRVGTPRRFVRVKGRQVSLKEAATMAGVGYALLCKRLERQWPLSRALLPPER